MYVGIEARDQMPCAMPSENLYKKVYSTLWLQFKPNTVGRDGGVIRSGKVRQGAFILGYESAGCCEPKIYMLESWLIHTVRRRTRASFPCACMSQILLTQGPPGVLGPYFLSK